MPSYARERIRRLCTVVLLAYLPACAERPGDGQRRAGTAAMPDSVCGYVRDAMDTLRAHSVHRERVDWTALEDSVLARADGARTPKQTWKALDWALRSVDPHSFLVTPQQPGDEPTSGTSTSQPGDDSTSGTSPSQSHRAPPAPTGRLLAGGIGLLTVPGHAGPNRPEYVDSLHAAFATLDPDAFCGWIVDLRDNTGGNMWPMLAGLGPLLGAEVVGSFDPAPAGHAWRYRNGSSWDGDSAPPAMPAGRGSAPPRALDHADAPVAILIGRRTASSGEMTLLAFLGRANVRTFGDSTAGFTSANAGFPLRDGAAMFVTVAYARDRRGRRHPLRIGPDELVTGDAAAAVDRATVWLRGQGGDSCMARHTH